MATDSVHPLLPLAKWLKDHHTASEVRVETRSSWNRIVVLLAATLDATPFSEFRVWKSMTSPSHLPAKLVSLQ